MRDSSSSNELETRRRQELLASVASPHPQSEEIAEAGLGEWGDLASQGDEALLDPTAGIKVRWSRDDGWVEIDE